MFFFTFRIFKAGLKLDIFYNLLVKETLENGTGGPKPSDTEANDTIDLENSKQALEVSHSFGSGSNYFFSYFTRTIAEFFVAVALLAWLLVGGK